MSDTVLSRPQLEAKPQAAAIAVFVGLIVLGLGFAIRSIVADVDAAGAPPLAIGAFLLLGLALLIALGFEFVNGFHDTANAVATVIYTHSLPANFAVVWSGLFNLLGVLTSSGTVAYSVITLLPVELILQVGSGAGYAMIFAPVDRRHCLEPGHLDARAAGQFLAHADRLDHWRGVCATSCWRRLAWARPAWIGGRPYQSVRGAADQPAGRLRRVGVDAAGVEEAGSQQSAVSGARGSQAAAGVDSRLAGADLHGRFVRAWIE